MGLYDWHPFINYRCVFTAVIVLVNQMLCPIKTDSGILIDEEVERQNSRAKPKAFCLRLSQDRQIPEYVFVVHLLGHNTHFQYDLLILFTKTMSIVCKQTVSTIACINIFLKENRRNQKIVSTLKARAK